MNAPVPATPLETREELLRRSKRRNQAVPIRNTFVQRGTQRRPEPGPLADLVRRHDELALDLYTFALALATAPPFAVKRRAEVWARAMGFPTERVSTVSKAWARLEDRKLIRRERQGRLSVVTLLREDGSGQEYTHPGSVPPRRRPGERRAERERYFGLSFAYWLDGFNTTLNLPAKAALLIALSLRPGFVLPEEKAPQWYGLSADTVQRGLAQLVASKLLRRQKEYKTAPLAPLGYTEQWHYYPRPPFGRQLTPASPGAKEVAETT